MFGEKIFFYTISSVIFFFFKSPSTCSKPKCRKKCKRATQKSAQGCGLSQALPEGKGPRITDSHPPRSTKVPPGSGTSGHPEPEPRIAYISVPDRAQSPVSTKTGGLLSPKLEEDPVRTSKHQPRLPAKVSTRRDRFGHPEGCRVAGERGARLHSLPLDHRRVP